MGYFITYKLDYSTPSHWAQDPSSPSIVFDRPFYTYYMRCAWPAPTLSYPFLPLLFLSPISGIPGLLPLILLFLALILCLSPDIYSLISFFSLILPPTLLYNPPSPPFIFSSSRPHHLLFSRINFLRREKETADTKNKPPEWRRKTSVEES